MKSRKNILGIVIARSKSKSLKNKNIKKIQNIPLLALPGILAKKSNLISKIAISTDSKIYGNIAKKFNIDFFFLIKKNLSGPKVPDQFVLRDALVRAEKYYNLKFDYVVSMPPTSPLRSRKDVEKAIKKTIKNKFDALWTISKIDLKYHPYKQLKIKNKKLKYFSTKGKLINYRQQLTTTYFRNGCAYVIKRNILLNKMKSLLTKNTGYEILNSPQISIDNEDDLNLARKEFKFSNLD